MSEQTNAAAERSAHVTRGGGVVPAEWPVVQLPDGTWQLKSVAERDAEIEKLRAENERLTNNARSDARLLAAYHKWCDMHGCAPSSSDLSKARAVLGEKDDAKV